MGLRDWTQTTGPGRRCLYPMVHLLPIFIEVYSTWITSLPYTSPYINNKHSISCSRLKCLAWFPCPACTVIAGMIVHIFEVVLTCFSMGEHRLPRAKPRVWSLDQKGKKKSAFWCHICSGVISDYFNSGEFIYAGLKIFCCNVLM